MLRMSVRHFALAAGISLAAPTFVGCGAAPTAATLSYGESARRDYERAYAAFRDNDCLTAVPLFQHTRREYPYSRYAALSELRSADCELEQMHYAESIRQYRAFIRARPTHPDIDYAHFRVAVAYFRQIPQDFFLSPPREERDQGPTRSALRIFIRFAREYPESEHLAEAARMQREVMALLARHELYVADYYLGRDRPRASIARLHTLLDDYEGSGVEPQALVLLGRTYLRLEQRSEARLAFADVVQRYPESGYAVQARDFISRIDSGTAVVDSGEPGMLPRAPAPEEAVEEDAIEEDAVEEDAIEEDAVEEDAAPPDEADISGEAESESTEDDAI